MKLHEIIDLLPKNEVINIVGYGDLFWTNEINKDTCARTLLKMSDSEVQSINVEDSILIIDLAKTEDEHMCSTCHAEQSVYMLNGDRIEYCGYCGNRIDWSDEE